MFGNRDPQQFDEPARVDFERSDVMRHIAFGSGAHNCLGSHLARRELRIVFDAWMDDMPPFRIADGDRPVTYGGSVFFGSTICRFNGEARRGHDKGTGSEFPPLF
jgi:cytochrome P450